MAIEETQPPSGRLWEKPPPIGIAEIPATAKTTKTANIKSNDFLLDMWTLYNFNKKQVNVEIDYIKRKRRDTICLKNATLDYNY